jgi:hypothetical protein
MLTGFALILLAMLGILASAGRANRENPSTDCKS